MKFEIEGTIATVFEKKQVSERFSKREFVLDVEDGKYKQAILFEASGRALDELGDFAAADVEVHAHAVAIAEWRSPRGETKYFNSLSAWKVERLGEKRERRPAARRDDSGAGFGGAGADDDIPW